MGVVDNLGQSYDCLFLEIQKAFKILTFFAHDNGYDVQECCDLDGLLHKI